MKHHFTEYLWKWKVNIDEMSLILLTNVYIIVTLMTLESTCPLSLLLPIVMAAVFSLKSPDDKKSQLLSE